MLKPQPSQVLPRLFWLALFTSLLLGFTAWSYAVYAPEAFTEHWLRNRIVLKAVHSLALGQLGLLFLAVGAQALPVLFHAPKVPAAPGRLGLVLWTLGVLLLISFFAGWRHPGVLLAAFTGLALGWIVMLGLARRALALGQGRSFAWTGLRSALLYLGAMILLGGAMAQGLLDPWLPQSPLANLQLHVHVGLWGFAGMAIFGFLPKLLRLFQASVGYAGWPLRACFVAVHTGLALLLLRWLGWVEAWSESVAGLLFLSAALLFVLQLLLLLRAAKGRHLDSSLGLQAGGIIFLVAAAGLDAWLLAGHGDWRAQAAAVALGLGGSVSLVLLGTLQRICAVLAWFQRFYGAARTMAVPTAWDLIHPGLAWSVLPLQAFAAAGLAGGLWTASSPWVFWAGVSGCLAQVATAALAWRALRWGEAKPFAEGKNPFAEWAAEEAPV